MNGQAVKFDIVSTRVIEPKNRKRFVAYKVTVQRAGDADDPNPASFERRYNEFLALYNGLKLEFPHHMAGIQFPRKAILGNFKPEIMLTRSASFKALLSVISQHSQLRHSRCVVSFLQDRELQEVISLIQNEQYDEARPLIENSFCLMNKVETDRSPSVLRWLCLLVSVSWLSGDTRAPNLAGLAIRRYQAVSDVDLLRYYVPLLQTAEDICLASGIDISAIRDQLNKLKLTGMSIDRKQNLLTLLLNDLTPLCQ